MNMKLIQRLSASALIVLAGTALSLSTFAAGGGGVQCPDIWAPVKCSNGKVYPNQCYADKAHAKNCVPYGDV